MRVPGSGGELIESEFDDVEREQWWESYEATVHALFAGVEEPIRLSQMLARAESAAESATDEDGAPLAPQLMVVAAVHAAHRAWATHLSGRLVRDHVVVAAATGAEIDTDVVRCADLLLVAGEVVTDIDTRKDGAAAALLDGDDVEAIA